VILYGIPADVAAECERVAAELRLARAEVKHLQAACVALKAHPRAMLVASSSIRSWDREVLEEHAARAGIPLRWVDADHTPDDVASEVRSWATETMRRARAAGR
jgi:tripartite-type tricarboxylate transporter receptor subunit TctC